MPLTPEQIKRLAELRAELDEKTKAEELSKSASPTPLNDPVENAEAALQGFGQGATLGYLPQLQAAAEPALAKVYEAVTGTNVSPSEDYVTRRDQYSDLQKKLQAANPKSYVGGQVGGALASAVAPVGTLSKGASLGAQTARSLQTGIAIRALQNPGDVQGEVSPLQLKERIESGADPTGLAIDTAIPAVGPAFGKLSAALKNQAERSAFKALGPYAKESIRAFDKGKVNEIGRTALDKKLISGMPKSYEALDVRATQLKDQAGKDLGSTIEGLAQTPEGAKINLSREEIAKGLRKELINPNIDIAGVSNRNAEMEKHANFFKISGGDLPLLNAEMKKRAVGQEINWQRPPGSDIPNVEQFNRALYSKLKSGVEKGGEELAQKTGYDVGKFKQQKSDFGNLAEAESILAKRNAKEFANRLISPSDYAAGATGAAIGAMTGGSPEEKLKHGAYGLALGLVNKGARKYGNQMSAMSADQLANLAAKLQQAGQATTDPETLLKLQMMLNAQRSQK